MTTKKITYMKSLYTLFFIIVSTSVLKAQVTLRITSLPSNTPLNSTIYIAGAVNNWNAASDQYIMEPDGTGNWTITIPEETGTSEYKFTRGSWAAVEGNATGNYLPNRTFTFTGIPQTINVTIASWEDLGGSGTTSTAAANVQILNNSFFMPQLNRNRKIWIYLPPDYSSTTKNYPVLYMEDGQNLFDNATSFSGEWHVDETLNTLYSQGDYGAIVIGIENGGSLRINEYSPWVNAQYGGGEGDSYVQFIAQTLKPYIDANYRTLPQPQFNALIGSSLGANISAYGAVKYPQYFSKVGLLSPAFWFTLSQMSDYITTSTNDLSSLRIYFVAGQTESDDMVQDINTIKNNFYTKNVATSNIFTKIDSYGTHTESYWSGEFAATYNWLFQEENLNSNGFKENKIIISQTLSGEIIASGLDVDSNFDLYSIQGIKVSLLTLKNGTNNLPDNLSSGIYFLKSKINSNASVFKVFKN